MTIAFHWDTEDAESLLATCERDGVFPVVTKYFPPGCRVLESGCGLGRYVKYLHDRGWDVVGLEFIRSTVDQVRSIWPELNIELGDVANSSFPDNSFDGIMSLGVVEHWPEGPSRPLREIYRLLKPGGYAIITVPVHNSVRQWKRWLWFSEITRFPLAVFAWITSGKNKPMNRRNSEYRYVVMPPYGDFFEYHMTVQEYRNELREVGFEIVEHVPIGIIDGLYHDLNPIGMLVRFQSWKFHPSWLGTWLNDLLARTPFLHCHMQAAVVRKPEHSRP